MARPFILEISEMPKYLARSLKQAQRGSSKERLLMLWWVKTGQVNQRQGLHERLGRSPATVLVS